MANSSFPQRVALPPTSAFSGDAYVWLQSVAMALNALPNFSFTSYSGGPNSQVTGNPGDVLINIVTSAQTQRLYIKELGSSNTGWVSVQTQ